MTTPAVREHQSPLEAALLDVHTTLADLLVAADEQHAAIVERDRERLENVTRQQERLSARLARAEAKRLEALGGASLRETLTGVPREGAARLEGVADAIATQVIQLKERQARTASLIEHAMDLADQTLTFLQRLVAPATPVYGARTAPVARGSLLVDGHA